MSQIGSTIESLSEKLNAEVDRLGIPWSSFCVVFESNDDQVSGNYGYSFEADTHKAFAIDNGDIDRIVTDLREITRDKAGLGWVKILIQFVRSNQSFSLDYEFDDADRWSISPANPETSIEALRPEE